MNERPNPNDMPQNKKNSYDNLYPPPPNAAHPLDAPEAPGASQPPQPFVMHSDEVETASRPQVRIAAPPAPKKPKAPFSPIPLLLIAGVAFLFLGGIIFLSNTWDMLPDAARALSLFSAGIIAFGANVLAERVFKLPKTGLAFYILGCIFLPLAMAGIGAFELMGKWFSFDGDGKDLLLSLVFLCVAAPALFGEKHYKSQILAWFGLTGIGLSWLELSIFIPQQFAVSYEKQAVFGAALLVPFAAGATLWSVWYCQRKKDTPICKVMTGFLYPMLAMYALVLIGVVVDNFDALPKGMLALTFVLLLVMTALFSNNRFLIGKIHTGIFGVIPCVFTAFFHFTTMSELFSDKGNAEFFFCATMTALVLMATLWIPKLHPLLRSTYSSAGLVLCLPMLMYGSGSLMFSETGGFTAFLYLLLFVGLIFFLIEKKNPLPKDAPFFCAKFAVLFVGAGLMYLGNPIMSVLLAMGALLLLAEAFLVKKLWALVLAIGACTAVLMQNLPCPMIWFSWFCTAALLTGVVYAHLCKRPLLEKCCAWTGISMLLSALAMTLDHFSLEATPLWTLVLAVVTLLYLLEAVTFWKHSRSEGTSRYLATVSLFMGFAAFISYLLETEFSAGWGFLILLMLGVFTVVFVRKPINFLSVAYLAMFFFTARHMIVALEEEHIIENTAWLHTAQIGGFILILAVFAGMGRLLLTEGFCDTSGARFQVDFPLLAGVLPVCGVSATIDWYPQILTALFLSLYSLLYIGRTKNRSIPTLLASFFGCVTIFFHNVYDPWEIMESLRELDIRTPQIILYVLPLHLFIFSLLWILPAKCKSGVHVARFCMYCFTMLCLLASSFTFGHVTDALILVLFSFAILVGSFFIKRLRWFTLGFAVLVVMTFRLTRMFWQSLHWSIYLFLAGAVLIGIASAYELNARKQAEHPDEPKKKFKPFSAWKW